MKTGNFEYQRNYIDNNNNFKLKSTKQMFQNIVDIDQMNDKIFTSTTSSLCSSSNDHISTLYTVINYTLLIHKEWD